MKQKPVSKDVPRAKIEEDTQTFLKKGGKIDEVETGISGVKPKVKPEKKEAKS